VVFPSDFGPVFTPNFESTAKTGDWRNVGPYRVSIPGHRMSSFVTKHFSRSLRKSARRKIQGGITY